MARAWLFAETTLIHQANFGATNSFSCNVQLRYVYIVAKAAGKPFYIKAGA